MLARGRVDALRYGVKIVPGSVVDVRRDEAYWLVCTEDGTRRQARELLLATGSRPLVCIVDDVQWLDTASVQALTFVARRSAMARRWRHRRAEIR